MLTWNTFLGGSHDDIGVGIAVNSDNNVYVTGMGGDAWGYPLAPYNGGFDAFVARLSSDGALMKNTNMGSIVLDIGTSVAVNGTNIYVTGYSRGTWGTPVRAYSDLNDGFVSKLGGCHFYRVRPDDSALKYQCISTTIQQFSLYLPPVANKFNL